MKVSELRKRLEGLDGDLPITIDINCQCCDNIHRACIDLALAFDNTFYMDIEISGFEDDEEE